MDLGRLQKYVASIITGTTEGAVSGHFIAPMQFGIRDVFGVLKFLPHIHHINSRHIRMENRRDSKTEIQKVKDHETTVKTESACKQSILCVFVLITIPAF